MTEPKDLIERLRNWRSGNYNYEADEYSQIPLAVEASDCIQSLTAENAALREKLAERKWQPIESAPKDGTPILAWCHYGCSDPKCPYSDEDYMPSDAWRETLCVFHAHAEGLSQVEEGLQVVVWGGGWVDGWEDGGGSLPDWWFRYGSEFEEAANPTHWMPLPEPPTLTGGDNAEG